MQITIEQINKAYLAVELKTEEIREHTIQLTHLEREAIKLMDTYLEQKQQEKIRIKKNG